MHMTEARISVAYPKNPEDFKILSKTDVYEHPITIDSITTAQHGTDENGSIEVVQQPLSPSFHKETTILCRVLPGHSMTIPVGGLAVKIEHDAITPPSSAIV